MARLISFRRNVVDPGYTSSQSVTESEQIQTHLAEFDVPATVEEVLSLRECPTFFSPLIGINGRQNGNLILIGREVSQHPDAPQVSVIRCTYSNQWVNQQNSDSPNVTFAFILDPTKRPAMVEWGTYVIREAVEFAFPYKNTINPDGGVDVPVVTSAGEPIIIEEEYHRRMLTITKNVQVIDEIFAENSDYINEEDTRIGGHLFKKHTLWLADVSIGHISMENGVLYYPFQMRIFHNPKTWIRRIRNQGFYMRDLNYTWLKEPGLPPVKSYPMKRITLSDGTFAQSPILLNKTGQPIQLKVKGWKPRAGNPNEKELDYEIQSPQDFGRAFTRQELESTVLYFRTKPRLNFTRKLPLN